MSEAMVQASVDAAIPRLRGITVVVVLMWFTVVLCILAMIVSLLLGLGSKPPKFPALVAAKYQNAAIGAYLAVAAGVLAVGLKRRRGWAWDGTVAWSANVVLVVALFSLESLSFAKSKPAGAAVLFVICLLWMLPAAAVIWYLSRAGTRRGFSDQWLGATAHPNAWIRLISARYILYSGVMLAEGLNQKLPPVFGVALHGFPQAFYSIASASMCLYAGFGLYRMKELARRCAIGFSAFGVARYLHWALTAPLSRSGLVYIRVGGGVEVALISAAIILYLIERRQDFVVSNPLL
jgi:hypothetical protein